MARIRVAPTLAAMLRCVAAALSRRSRDLPERWVARRLFWRESGEEIRSACLLRSGALSSLLRLVLRRTDSALLATQARARPSTPPHMAA